MFHRLFLAVGNGLYLSLFTNSAVQSLIREAHVRLINLWQGAFWKRFQVQWWLRLFLKSDKQKERDKGVPNRNENFRKGPKIREEAGLFVALQMAHSGRLWQKGLRWQLREERWEKQSKRPGRSQWGAGPLGNWEALTSFSFCKTLVRHAGECFLRKKGAGGKAKLSIVHSQFWALQGRAALSAWFCECYQDWNN